MLIALLVLAPTLLVAAIALLMLWHRAHRARIKQPLYESSICHIGITIGVVQPQHAEQVLAAIDSRYPLCEVVVVADLATSPCRNLIQRFHLVKVNAEQLLDGYYTKGLYRSHRRSCQQLVMVDMPQTSPIQPREVIRRVAAYPHLMILSRGAMLCNDSATYVANTIASYPLDEDLLLRTIVGAKVVVEPTHPTEAMRLIILSRPLAYHRTPLLPILCALATIVAPVVPISISAFSGERLALLPAIIIIVIGLIGIYLSCRIATKRGLFTTFGTISINFYRFLVEDMRNFCYLYKKCERNSPINEFCSLVANREKTYYYDRTDKKLPTPSRLQRRPTSRRGDYDRV